MNGPGSVNRRSSSGSRASSRHSASANNNHAGDSDGEDNDGADDDVIDRTYRYKGKKWFDLENPAAEPLFNRVRREAAENMADHPQTIFARGMSAGVPVASFQRGASRPSTTKFPRLHPGTAKSDRGRGSRTSSSSRLGSPSSQRRDQRSSGSNRRSIPKPSFSSPILQALGSSFSAVKRSKADTVLHSRTQKRLDARAAELQKSLKAKSKVVLWASRKEQERLAQLEAEAQAAREKEASEALSYEEAERQRKIAAIELFEKAARKWYHDQLLHAYEAWVELMELARLREEEQKQMVKKFDESFPEAPHSRAKVVLRDMLGLVDKLMNSKVRANWEFLEYSFKVHDWALTPYDLENILRSFNGISQFRESQVQRILFRNNISGFRQRSKSEVEEERALKRAELAAKGLAPSPDDVVVLEKIALAPNGEPAADKITWEQFCVNMGKRPPQQLDEPVKLHFPTNGFAATTAALQPEKVIRKMSAFGRRKMKSFSKRHKSAIVKEFHNSKMDIEQWEQVALKAVVGKVQTHTAGKFQSAMRGWFVRHQLMEKNREQRCIHFFAIHWMNRVAGYFVAWRKQAAAQRELRERCWPKIRAWRGFAVAQKTRMEVFRICFWPFHVWRRETWANILARDKAKFLVRVNREFLKIRHLRAWYRYLLYRKDRRAKVKFCLRTQLHRWCCRVLHEWHRVAEKSKSVLNILKTRQRAFGSFLKCCFLALRYHALGKKVVETSSLRYRRILPNAFTVDRDRVARAVRRERRSKGGNGPLRNNYLGSVHENESTVKGDNSSNSDPVDFNFYGHSEVGIADAELVAETAQIAQDGLPSFPTPTQLNLVSTAHSSNTEQSEMINWVCRPMTEAFHKQLVLRTKQCWHLARVILPTALRQWVRAADLRRKDRFIAYRGYLVNVRFVFRLWQRGVEVAKEERLFLERERNMTPEERFERKRQRTQARVEQFLDEWDDRNDWREAGVDRYNELQSRIRKSQRKRKLRLKKLHGACPQQAETFRQRAAIGKDIIEVKSQQNRELRAVLAKVGDDLIRDRARVLHDTMCKVFSESEQAGTLTWKKKCFNRLVLVVRQKHALPRHKHARIQNWLNICARLRYLYRVMPTYHQLRTKWRVWCGWLRFIEMKYQNETPGLNEEVMRRRQLMRMFHRCLQRLLPMQAFAGGSALYVEDTTARRGLFSLEGAMSRWVEYTQVSICRRRMLRIIHLLRDHRVKRMVFMSLKIGLRTARLTRTEAVIIGHSISRDERFQRKQLRLAKLEQAVEEADRLHRNTSSHPRAMILDADNTTEAIASFVDEDTDDLKAESIRDESGSDDDSVDSDQDEEHLRAAASAARTTLLPKDSFYSRRLRADLDKWRTKFLSSYHRSKPYMYRRRRATLSKQMHLQVTNGIPIMKRLLHFQREDVERRLKHEQKLLCNAFKDRDKQRWDEFCVHGVGDDDDESDDESANGETGHTAHRHRNHHDEMKIVGDPIEPFVESGFPQDGALLSVIVFADDNGVHGVARTVTNEGVGTEAGEVHGCVDGRREVFELGSNDCLSIVEGYATKDDGIARLRFHTLLGRRSPWFGVRPPSKPGTYFHFDASVETRKFDFGEPVRPKPSSDSVEEGEGDGDNSGSRPPSAQRPQSAQNASVNVAKAPRIIGFCGRKSEKKLTVLGVLVRRKLAPNVFGNCWVTKANSSDAAKQELATKAENDFAIVLRMRGSYVMDLLKRSQNLAKKMRATKTRAPDAIGEVRIAFQFSKWYFEALTFGLVKVPTREEEKRANEFMTRGMRLLARGNKKVQAAEAIFRELSQYSSTEGKVTLDPAVLGAQKVLELNSKMSQAQFLKSEGQVRFVEAASKLPATFPCRARVFGAHF